MTEEILKPINVMNDDELISILTIKKENFNEEYKSRVLSELNNRGIKFDELLKIAKYKLNAEDIETVNVDLAYERLTLLKEPIDVLTFINSMNEHLSIQKNHNYFLLHHYTPDKGFSSFFVDEDTILRNLLSKFLTLGNWLPDGSEVIKHWETFVDSSSSAYILRLAKILDDADVVYSINSNVLARFSSFNSPYSIVVPTEVIDEANESLEKIDELKISLHRQLELAEENENIDLQLELLVELESVTPEDSILFYNKAQILDEKGDYQNASEALIESFNLDLSNGVIEDVDDTQNYLIEVLEKVEEKGNILHCLATIATFNEDSENTFKYYNQLVELDEKDSVAHLNLGYYFYSNTDDDEKVKFHFNKFIELEPESDEVEAIEAILKNIVR